MLERALLFSMLVAGRLSAALTAGDVAVIGVNTDDGDEFAWVALVEIAANTTVNFTENGIESDGSLRTTEGTRAWSHTSAVSAGTVITYSAGSWSTGTVTSTKSWALSASGDQIIVYTGTSSSPTFIFALNLANSGWITSGDASSTKSYLPSGLTDGTNALHVSSQDNGYYASSNGTSGTRAELLAKITGSSNWTTSNSDIETSSWVSSFTVSSPSVDDPSSFSAAVASATLINLSWSQNSDGDDVMVATNSTNSFGTPSNGTSYSVGNSLTGGGTVIYSGSATSYSHTSLTGNTAYYYKAWSKNSSTNYSSGVTTSGTTLKAEPTNHASSVTTAVSNLNITLTWTDATAGSGEQTPDGYLVKMKNADSITAPSDGTVESDDSDYSDGTGATNVSQGTGSASFIGLSPLTTYYFKLYPYTNSGTSIDYKTDGAPGSTSATTGNRVTELLFSEVVEGSSDNKVLEIFNPNSQSVDLSNYRIRIATNGGGWSSSYSLSGTVTARDVYVIANSGAQSGFTAEADTTTSGTVVNFNGDDARALEKTSDSGTTWTAVDQFGDPDTDPGSGWSVAGTSDATKDHTLVRKATVSAGNVSWTSSAGTDTASSEWTLYDSDTYSTLGSHSWKLVKITETDGSTQATEGGATDSYTITLRLQPTVDVTITATTGSQLSVSPSTLTFTSSDWSTAQTVTVTAVDDASIEGSHTGAITHSVSSSDGYYNAHPVSSLSVSVVDNDAAGVTVSETDGSTAVTEGGATDSYTMVLNTQPTADVTITVTSSTSEVSMSPTSLTFSSSNWSTSQSVTVTAADDSDYEGSETATISHAASSSDANYSAITVSSVSVSITDNEAPRLVMNEIHYNPSDASGYSDADYEFIELYNREAVSLDLSGFAFTAGISHTFASGTSLAAGSYLVIARKSATYSGSVEWTSGSLSNDGEKILLATAASGGTVLDSVVYSGSSLWPTAPDGSGPSLELINPLLNNTVGVAWKASSSANGTPGEANSIYDADPGPLIYSLSRAPPVPTAAEDVTVSATVTDNSALSVVKMVYAVNGGTASEVDMTASGTIYSGTLPTSSMSDGNRVSYWITATDDASQTAYSDTSHFFVGTTDMADLRSNGSDGASLYSGYYCRVNGTATVASGVLTSSNLLVYLQDSTAGLAVYKSGATSVSITAGNSYTVVGKLSQYNGNLEIVPDDASSDVTDGGASTVSTPMIKSISQLEAADLEQFEGRLITIENVTRTSTSAAWPSSGSDAELAVSDDGGTLSITVMIDADTDVDEQSEPAYPMDITGILYQYDTTAPYTSGYRLVPRSAGDLKAGQMPTTVAFAGTTQSVAENSGTLSIPVKVENVSSVSATTAQIVLKGGDSTNFPSVTSQTVTFPAEDTTRQSASFSLVDDATYEGDRQAIFAIRNVSGEYGAAIGEDSLITVTIVEDDLNTTVQFVDSAVTVTEGIDPTVTVPVSIVRPASASTLVDLILAQGDSTDIGGFVKGTVTFPADSSSNQTVVLGITDDDMVEKGETLTFVLRNASGGNSAQLGSRDTLRLNILDNDVFPVVINEIHYNPGTAQGSDADFEFLELFNFGDKAALLSGYSFSQGIGHTFSDADTIAPYGALLLASNAATYEGATEWQSGGLKNDGEAVVLVSENGFMVDSVTYGSGAPWPRAADGEGPSLQLIHPVLDNGLAASWIAGDETGGTPGSAVLGNAPPEGVSDRYSVLEDDTLSVAAPGVLSNDTDWDGDTLKASLTATPLHGTLNFDVAGAFTYIPDSDFFGHDTFSYASTDGKDTSEACVVVLEVSDVNDPPTPFEITWPPDSFRVGISARTLHYRLLFAWRPSEDIDDKVMYRLAGFDSLSFLTRDSLASPALMMTYEDVVPGLDTIGVVRGEWTVEVFDEDTSVSATNGPFTIIFDQRRLGIGAAVPIPDRYALYPNSPNPFNPVTTIRYDLPERGEIDLAVFDLLGRRVATIVQTMEEPGFKSVSWRGEDSFGRPLAGGVYLCRLTAGTFTETRKMVLLK